MSKEENVRRTARKLMKLSGMTRGMKLITLQITSPEMYKLVKAEIARMKREG